MSCPHDFENSTTRHRSAGPVRTVPVQARLTMRKMIRSMAAPIKALMIEAITPPPTEKPRRGNSQPAKKAPITPTMILPIRPKPPPCTTLPASQPATSPTKRNTRRLPTPMRFSPSQNASREKGRSDLRGS
ncbi:Hypothetical protein, conserved [Brucella suis ATCC 23445]|uniref:Uncharacterized protein n=1 Tax=Brucella suis (strain ATCC 23445 / NCTC 10510) TaxID=470137 RepID=A9WWV9_BRUSI|nr:Hypothetical protein, conserved [Brucella suis ATCC 23445]